MLVKRNQLIQNKSSVDFMVEFRTSTPTKFFRKYNIILNKDGSIYDLDLKCVFECMYNWANAIQSEA